MDKATRQGLWTSIWPFLLVGLVLAVGKTVPMPGLEPASWLEWAMRCDHAWLRPGTIIGHGGFGFGCLAPALNYGGLIGDLALAASLVFWWRHRATGLQKNGLQKR